MNVFFASGDGPFYYPSNLNQLSWLPQAWNWAKNLGESNINRLWYESWVSSIIKLFHSAGLEWVAIDKILWISVFIIAVYCASVLASRFFQSKLLIAVSAIIYASNTYLLMLFGGGQFGVSVGFAAVPLFLNRAMEWIDGWGNHKPLKSEWIRQSLIDGLWITLLVAFDLRMAILAVGVVIVYAFFTKPSLFLAFETYIRLGIAGIVAAVIHAFWIVPSVMYPGSVITDNGQYSGGGIVKFLSSADFSHALSLLHPNWPDNIFGKVYFLQPEYLFLPFIAFASLVFLNRQTIKNRTRILFFSLIGLIGAFLSSGENGPLGGIYAWSFLHIPGFVLYRDPTKFYLFVALSYAILIPYTLTNVSETVSRLTKKEAVRVHLNYVVIVLFLLFWGILIRQLFLGQLTGNFRPQPVPSDYQQFMNLIQHDSRFSRTLWLPQPERLGYADMMHPVIDGTSLFPNSSLSAVILMVRKPDFTQILGSYSIRYIVVPADYEKRIFQTQYVFDKHLRDELITAIDKSSLRRLKGFTSLSVYENTMYDALITAGPENESVIFSVTPKGMIVIPKTTTVINTINFQMAYDPGWILRVGKMVVKPEKTTLGMIRYSLSPVVSDDLILQYSPSRAVNFLSIVSIVSIVLVSVLIFITRKKL